MNRSLSALLTALTLVASAAGPSVAATPTSERSCAVAGVAAAGKKPVRLELRATADAAGTTGTARLTPRGEALRIDVDVRGLEPAERLGFEYLTYVLWSVDGNGTFTSLGPLEPAKGRARLTASVPPGDLGLLVTAEPYFAVAGPSAAIVATSALTDKDAKRIAQREVPCRVVSTGYYAFGRTDVDVALLLRRDARTPLALLEARHARKIAELAGAAQHAAESFREVSAGLLEAEQAQQRKPGGDDAVLAARNTVVGAETARAKAEETGDRARMESAARAEAQRAEAERAAADARRQVEAAAAERVAQDKRLREEAERRASVEQAMQEETRRRAEAEAQLKQLRSTPAGQELDAVAAERARLEAERAQLAAERTKQQADLQAERARMEAERAQIKSQQTEEQATRDRTENQTVRVEVEKARREAEQSRIEAEVARREAEFAAESARLEVERARLDAERKTSEAEKALEAERRALATQARVEQTDAQRQAERERMREQLELEVQQRELERERARFATQQQADQSGLVEERAKLEAEWQRAQTDLQRQQLELQAERDALARSREQQTLAQQESSRQLEEQKRLQLVADRERMRAESEAAERERQAALDLERQRMQAEMEAERLQLQAQFEAEKAQRDAEAEAERLRQRSELVAERQRVQTQLESERQQLEQAAATAERQRQEKAASERTERRTRLLRQLTEALDARDTERGLLVNMSDVGFDAGQFVLKTSARESLARLAGILVANPGLTASIEGHTDATGNAEANQILSEKRAMAVRDYLAEQGVAPASMTASGFGAERPVAPNETAEGRRANRRIECVIAGEAIGQKAQ